MDMTRGIRKFALTAHVTFSVGWLGAVAGFLALALSAGLTSQGTQMVRAAYLAMELTGWYVIVPLCLASLLTGLVVSLGTNWGLFQHYWVLVKFLITIVSILILFGFTQTLSSLGDLAADTTSSIDDLSNLSQSPVLHSSGGLVALLVTTTLAVYKPWGMTRYGRRKQADTGVEPGHGSTTSTPRWAKVFGIIVIGLVLLFVILHITGNSLGGH